ncbi:MAG: hypothetical protein OEV94_01280 [Deltaproteobacteria bacterium]|nr:hypothetical protein [Deltaproteobacteria bacterium]
MPPQRALSTVRLSFSLHNRLADLDDCFQRWKLAMEKLVKL